MLGRTLSRNIFQPAFFNPRSSNLAKFCRHDHKGLVNTSTEGIDELLHGLGEIDEILSKIGVFSRTPKLQFEGARESEGFRARQDGLGTPQGVTKSSRNNPSSWVRESTKENRISIKPKHKSYEIEMNPKPRRAQGGLCLLSRSISVHELKNPSLTSLA